MDDSSSFGYWVRRRRKALDLTQEQLGKQVGCSAATVRKIEADERRPSVQTAKRLANSLLIEPERRADFLKKARGELIADELPPPALLVKKQPSDDEPLWPAVILTPLVGRTDDLVIVQQQILRPDVRLMSLTGPPGVGKTRLALQIKTNLQGEFADGACFVALASIHDPELVFTTIAQAFALAPSGDQPLLARLMRHLQPRELLLILDNMEQLTAVAPVLTRLRGTPVSLPQTIPPAKAGRLPARSAISQEKTRAIGNMISSPNISVLRLRCPRHRPHSRCPN